jgi:uncharacterized RDD family membrane protein YckC
LSERVVNFRKRRARLHPDADPAGNLELDFERPDELEDIRSIFRAQETPEERASRLDLEIGEPAMDRELEGPSPETLSLEDPGDEMMQLDAAPDERGEMSLGESVAKSSPMEIQVGSPAAVVPEEEASGIFLAPLGRRFLAGLTDALVLLVGAALFGTIFWFWCGYLTPVPATVAVLGVAAVILIFAYFAVFTAIASATPGLLLMGCEIRNLHGDHPTVRESFWRAFGVLVSLSALMLGFIWACVDSDTLTWHDRMSGTVIAEEHIASDLAGLNVTS